MTNLKQKIEESREEFMRSHKEYGGCPNCRGDLHEGCDSTCKTGKEVEEANQELLSDLKNHENQILKTVLKEVEEKENANLEGMYHKYGDGYIEGWKDFANGIKQKLNQLVDDE